MAKLFVISAPSGTGKTTLSRQLPDRVKDLVYSVSYTTREPRPGETDGRDYFFISRGRFQEMIDEGAFLEWAQVFGELYGTGRAWVEDQLSQGSDVLADVDTDGAKQIRANFSEAVFIFILPPTFAELGRRLRLRHTETKDQQAERLGRARAEIEARTMYNYLVINDGIEHALGGLAALVEAERLRLPRATEFWTRFFSQ